MHVKLSAMNQLNLRAGINLEWELTVLTRCVAYGNLSSAAMHVGLSQPQLTRIVAKIEEELGVVLLDRVVRRKSSWTPIAFRIAEMVAQSRAKFETDLLQVVLQSEPKHLRVATLEGMIPIASHFLHRTLKRIPIQLLELHVYDLNALEEKFIAGDLDLIFTVREPGKKKFKKVQRLGFQPLVRKGTRDGIRIQSVFEFQTQVRSDTARKDGDKKTLVSNSLELRRFWQKEYGGEGIFPGAIQAKRSTPMGMQGKGEWAEVLLIASDGFSPKIWPKLSGEDLA